MTAKEERYVHYVQCCESLNTARCVLLELRTTDKTKRTAIHAAAFRFALVEYAKPYIASRGIHSSDGSQQKKKKAYKLGPPTLLTEDLTLHKQILDLRDQVLAHSDMTLKDAHVSFARYGGQANVSIGGNCPLPLPDIVAVIGLIERTLDNMCKEKALLIESLEPKGSAIGL